MEAVISKRTGWKEFWLRLRENRWVSRLLPILFLAFIVGLFTVLTGGRFAATRNLKNVLDQALVVATVATGATFIFGTGNVNIAMGACTALTATLAAMVYIATESLLLMCVSALIFGVTLLVACALLSTIFRVQVIFVTIVMMVMLSSMQSEILGGSTINLPYAMTSALQNAGFSYVVFLIFFVLCGVLFHFTKVGRMIKFTGSNQLCAKQTGISRNTCLLIAFAVAGIGVGLGALLNIMRTASITTYTLNTLNMDCMLAIVLGGMPVFGGSKSRSYAAIIGALTVTVLNSGLLMIGVSATFLQGVRGIIFIFLVLSGHERPDTLPSREG